MIIDCVGDDGETFYTKGHVEPADFIRELYVELFSLSGITPDDQEIRPHDIKHSHARIVPSNDRRYDAYIYFNQKPGHGAFEVTYVDL